VRELGEEQANQVIDYTLKCVVVPSDATSKPAKPPACAEGFVQFAKKVLIG
jgi:hypothetical protein